MTYDPAYEEARAKAIAYKHRWLFAEERIDGVQAEADELAAQVQRLRAQVKELGGSPCYGPELNLDGQVPKKIVTRPQGWGIEGMG